MVTEILQNIEHKMNTSVDVLRKDLSSIRTGHATPALVEILGCESPDQVTALGAAAVYANPEDRARWQAIMDQEGVVPGFEAQWRRRTEPQRLASTGEND